MIEVDAIVSVCAFVTKEIVVVIHTDVTAILILIVVVVIVVVVAADVAAVVVSGVWVIASDSHGCIQLL